MCFLNMLENIPKSFKIGYNSTIFEPYSTKNMSKGNIFINTALTFLTDNERIAFFILYLVIFSLSMIANIATLFTTFRRQIRLIQKACIISLALSDIVVCIFFGVTNMVMFSHPMVDWPYWQTTGLTLLYATNIQNFCVHSVKQKIKRILGDFLCSFIPYMQIVGSLANSITMTAIALDRYRNIVHPLNKQWDPNIWLCVLLLIAIWGVSASCAYPMIFYYIRVPIFVFIKTNDPKRPLGPFDHYLCGTWKKDKYNIFFSVIFSLIFFPLMLLFLWLYYKIAQLIWNRRRPVVAKSCKNNSVTLETSTSDTKTTNTKPSPVTAQIDKRMKSIIKSSKLHMERKIRTFKIILVIMIVFFVCRMPHWLFALVKLSRTNNEPKDWVISFTLSALLILNTTLNPFLYSFLNQTLMYFDKIFVSVGEFISNICCCCCSNSEFNDFEKDNPFPPEMYDQRPSQASSIIPRGPYMECINNKSNHVKFHDIAVINMYPKEGSSQNLNCNTY